MALDSGSERFTPGEGVGRFDRPRLNDLAFVIAGAVIVMTLVRFFPKSIGGWALLAITLLLLRNLYMGGSI